MVVRRFTGRARRLRREQTDAEKKLWRRLRNRQVDGWKFRRQVPHGAYILDFYCIEAKLVIEVDGSQHADLKVTHDAIRTAELETDGLRVLRFWNAEVLNNIEGVLEAIYLALGQKQAAPPVTSR
ncbi:MAG: endonuclease domain-containing protein [Alphaproteobacteria bacterium]|nr:endonuclease domain-containing protein [Alphaproteobacteria bacterium]